MKIVIANWKSNPNSLQSALKLANETEKSASSFPAAETVISPPFVYLSEVRKELVSAKLCAQDVFWNEGGAYTGEVNLAQLKELGVSYVIVGHSERRNYLKESDPLINQKLLASLRYGFKVVLCVGNKEKTDNPMNFINKQLAADLKELSREDNLSNLIVAYEPIWAIGTGDAENPENAAEISKKIKERIDKQVKYEKIKVLYGGSVDEKNIESFMEKEEIDGVLVGGASLKPPVFARVIKSADKHGEGLD